MEALNLNRIPVGSNPVVHVSQYDVGRVFRFNLFDGSNVYTLDGTETIECNIRKLDGNVVTVGVTNTSSDYIDVVTTEQMTAIHGQNYGEIVFKKGGNVIGSVNFILQVEQSPLEGGITSDSAIYNLQVQVANYVAIEVANQYDSANVIFDPSPVQGHGNGYTVTSEGIGTALDTKQDNITTKTASGDLITISDGGDNIPLKSCEVTIDPDLSGKTECNLVVCGKNLVNWKVSPTSNALSVSFKPNTYTISAQSTLSDGNWYMRFTKNDNSFISDSSIVGLTGWNYASSGWFYGGPQTQSKAFIIPNDCVLFECGKLNSDGTIYAQIEVGNQATTYTPYQATTYNIPFGTTVYGGEGNMLTGEFVSEWGKYTITNDTILTNYNTSVEFGSWAMVSQIGVQKIDNTNIMAFCDVATGVSFNQRIETANQRRVYTDQTGQVVIRAAGTDNITSLGDLKNLFMGANICYALATPTSLTLTPVNPKTISGTNNIYNDCGSTAIEYFPNTVDGFVTLIKDYNVTDATELPISDSDPTNTKAYIDSGLSGKADSSNVYPKTDVYTKTEVNNLLGWEYINTIVDNGATADISNYETIIALPLANGTNKYNPYTIWKSMLSGTISLTMFRSNSYYWTGTLTLTGDTLSVTNNELTGWTSVTVAIYGKKS